MGHERIYTSFSLSLILLDRVLFKWKDRLETQLWIVRYLKCSNVIKYEIILEKISLTGSETNSYFNTVVQCFRLILSKVLWGTWEHKHCTYNT